MNPRLALKLASRINALLLRELTQGVDAARMLADPLYARDVLLVCDAYRGNELATLAQQFRAVVTAAQAETARPVNGTAHGGADARHGGPHGHNGHHRPGGAAADGQRNAARDSRHDAARDSTGFSASRFFSSLFGPMVPLDAPSDVNAQPPRSWFGRSRSADK